VVQLSLEHGRSIAGLLVAAAAALALTARFYRACRPELSRRRWLLLVGLRSAAIVLVLLLLFRPVFSLQTDVRHKRAVVLLLDASASMATADDSSGQSRFERARTRVVDWHRRLHGAFDLHLLTFAGSAAPVKRPEDLAAINPEGQSTSLVRALQAAGQAAPRRDIEAIFLLSDGVHNTAGDPVQAARALGVVVHTVGVGNSLRDSPSYRDVQVTGIDCPPELVVNNRARVRASVDSVGLTGRVVQVLLEEDGKTVAGAELTLTGSGQEAVLEFLPAVKGRHTYTVRTPVLAEEKIAQNNQRSAAAVVVDARILVLYIEGALRAEYGALVDRFLSKDPDVEFCAVVQTRRNVFQQRTNIAGLKLTGIPTEAAVLDKFNVIVLGDLDAGHLRQGRMEALVRRVRDGAGLVMLGGYNSLGPGGYAGTPLEAVLPVSVGGPDVGQVSEPFLPQLTPEGRVQPIFAGIAKFFPTKGAGPAAEGLPPLDGCVKVAGARPGAAVLAVHPGTTMPVLAVQPAGKGRTAVFTGDTTRNWQQGPRALDQESPFLRFWGQLVRWLAGRTDTVRAEAGVLARTDRSWYEPDAPILISAVVRDKDGEGDARAQVAARIKRPFGQDETIPLTAVAGPAGHYTATYEPRQPGRYEITVTARRGGSEVQSEKLVVEVGRPDLEYERLDLDDKMLSRIAAAAAGRYAHLDTADRLIDELDRKERRRRVYLEQRLYFPALYCVLIVGVLGMEWGLRRRYQLR
jgi:uncharacterized membrane protein